MAKLSKIIIVMLLYTLHIGAQNLDKYDIVLFPVHETKKIPLYVDSDKSEILELVGNRLDNSIEFVVKEKVGHMIHVEVWYEEEMIKGGAHYKEGWIHISQTGIYYKAIKGEKKIPVVNLYSQHSYKADKIVLDNLFNFEDFFQVIDIHRTWLKVKVKYHGKIYLYWLPRECQCQSIYNECN